VDTGSMGDASPTWRAIEHRLDLLKKGIIWRVGPRTKIQIWRDPWIPRPPSLKISLKKGRDTIAMGILVDDPWEARMGHTSAENLFLSS
jgi:hypothetical protein